MNQDQLKSLLTLCGGNNSTAKDLNVKVDPNTRNLQMDVITPGEITRYLRTPTPEYSPPAEVTDAAMGVVDAPSKPATQPVIQEVKPPTPQSVPTKKAPENSIKPDVVYNADPAVMNRIADALERIAGVLEERFPEIEFTPPKTTEAFLPPSTIELASKENRFLNDNPNA